MTRNVERRAKWRRDMVKLDGTASTGGVVLLFRTTLRHLFCVVEAVRSAWDVAQVPASTAGRWRSRFILRIFIRKARENLSRLAGQTVLRYRATPFSPATGDRPRIVHVIANLAVGGSTQLVVDLQRHLGHLFDMHVVTSFVPSRGGIEGMVTHHAPQPATPERMEQLFVHLRPDLVHIHYWGDTDEPWYGAAFAGAERTRCVVVQNLNTPVPPFVSPAVDTTVYVSHYVQKAFGGVFERETVIHPGIDLDAFAPDASKPADAHQTIGMVYRLEPDKLDISAIDTLVEIVRARPSIRVLVVGDGSLFRPFVRATERGGVRGAFAFLGAVPYERLPGIYAQISVFIAPVWNESFGQVTPFAMAAAKPVAGFDVGALPEILESRETLGRSCGETGRIVLDLLSDPARMAKLGEQNREIAERRFSVRTMSQRYLALYRTVLERSSGARSVGGQREPCSR